MIKVNKYAEKKAYPACAKAVNAMSMHGHGCYRAAIGLL